MSETLLYIYIFIRDVYAAGEADLAVDDGYLAVVTVIHNKADGWHKTVECHCPYAPALERGVVICRQDVDAAHVVVNYAHINAGGSLAL